LEHHQVPRLWSHCSRLHGFGVANGCVLFPRRLRWGTRGAIWSYGRSALLERVECRTSRAPFRAFAVFCFVKRLTPVFGLSQSGHAMDGPQQSGVVLHLLLVGFHHTKGNYIEYCHPPTNAVDTDTDKPPLCASTVHCASFHSVIAEVGGISTGWNELPFVAVPDGAHAFEEDFVFFTAFPLPTDPGEVMLVLWPLVDRGV
jgi:hypothetical protein